MKCIKNCECNKCEMLEINHPIVFIKQKNLQEHRETLVGFKCNYYGTRAETTKKLKTSNLYDDFIYLD